jgi:urea transport system substrate-binding protein
MTVNKVSGDESLTTDKVIKVGILHSLTGTMAISERSLVDAIKMAIEEVNAKGGILGRKIVPIIEDGASDWPTFAKKAKKLIYKDKVSSVFGCWTSASRKKVLPIFEESNNLLWYPVQYEGGESSPNVIYTGAAPNQQIIPALKWGLNNLGKRIFLVGSDYVFPIEANRIIKEYIRSGEGTIVGEEYRELGDKNFEEIVAMIKKENPDVIINTVNGDSNVGFFSALDAAWSKHEDIPPVISLSIAEDELITIGMKSTIGNYGAWNYFQSIDSDINKKFVRNFKKRYGSTRVTDDPIEAAYCQVLLFAKAVEKAKSINPQEIRDAARGIRLIAPNGPIRIDENNQHTWKTARIGRINKDGQFDIVWRSTSPIRPEPYLEIEFDNWKERLQKIKQELRLVRSEINNGDNNFNAIIAALNSTFPEIRKFAVEKLPSIKNIPTSIIEKLSSWVNDTDLLVSQSTVVAITRLGQRGSRVLPALTDALKHPRAGVRFRAEKGIALVARKLENQRKIGALQDLVIANSIMNASHYSKKNLEIVQNAVAYLTKEKEGNIINVVTRQLASNKLFWVALVYLIWFLLLMLGTRVFPLWIYRVNSLLQPKEKARITLPGFEIPLIDIRYLFLFGFFYGHERVLDAWVDSHIKIASKNFKNFNTVKDRKVYIPVPVALDGNKLNSANVDNFIRICNKKRWCIHITGQGGTGKTALACQLALWGLDDDGDARLFKKHKSIPILIEPGLGSNLISNVEILKQTISGQLTALIDSTTEINSQFLNNLLRKQRIIVIIDDLSALTDSMWDLPGKPGFPVSALIVTSRSNAKLANAPISLVEPLRVHGERLSSFMDAYLTKAGFREHFKDMEFFNACEKLTSMVGEDSGKNMRTMTVLFAKMYAEQLIGIKKRGDTSYPPGDIPSLMLGYLDELNRTNMNPEFNNCAVHRVSKVIAWLCMKDTYQTSVVKRSTVIKEIGKNNERLLIHLEERLKLVQSTGIDHDGVRFSIDPLAEYLAAFYLIGVLGGGKEKWSEFLKELELNFSDIESTRWFLLALRDCCLTSGRELGVPTFVPEYLSELTGINSASKDNIKVGVLHSMTGNMAISERSLVDAIRLAVDEVNSSGGVLGRKIICITEDGCSDESSFQAKAKKLIKEDKVCSVFGCWTSASRKAVLPIFEETDNLLWYPVQYEGGESSPNIIYTGAAPNQQIIPAIKWCLENLGKNIFLVGSDYIFPHKANSIIKAYLKQQGLGPMGEEYLPLGERDFREIINSICETNTDVIFNTVNGDSNMGLFNELRECEKTKNIPVMSVSIAEDEILSIGRANTVGHYCAWNYFQSVDSTRNKQFVAAFQKVFGEHRVTDDPILFAKAVEKAGNTEPRAIRESARSLKFSAPGGDVMIDKDNQHTWKTARIGKINTDGQFDIVWESSEPIKPDPYPDIIYAQNE